MENCLRRSERPFGRGQDVHPHFEELLARVFGGAGEFLLLHFHLENLMEEGLQSGFGLFQGDSRLEPAEDLSEAAAPVVERVEPVGQLFSIIMGTRTCGEVPGATPSKPLRLTPTMVSG